MPHSRPFSLRCYLWISLLLLICANILGMRLVHLTPQLDSALLKALVLIIILTGASVIFRHAKTSRFAWTFSVLATLTEAYIQSILLIINGLFFSYIGCAVSAPFEYRDDLFLKMDKLLGFEWLAWMTQLNQHTTLALGLGYLYESYIYQFFLVIIIYSVCLESALNIQRFLLATLISIVICVLICIPFPSTAIYTFLHLPHDLFPNISMKATFRHIPHLTQLRDGTMRNISFGEMRGLLTFPSPHASFAVLLLWAFSSIRGLRWFMGAVNLLMLVSVPLIGGHYLVDAIAGVVIAILAIASVKYFEAYRLTV